MPCDRVLAIGCKQSDFCNVQMGHERTGVYFLLLLHCWLWIWWYTLWELAKQASILGMEEQHDFLKRSGTMLMTSWSRAAITAWSFMWASKKLLSCLSHCYFGPLSHNRQSYIHCSHIFLFIDKLVVAFYNCKLERTKWSCITEI